jgi:hypothetical protein
VFCKTENMLKWQQALHSSSQALQQCGNQPCSAAHSNMPAQTHTLYFSSQPAWLFKASDITSVSALLHRATSCMQAGSCAELQLQQPLPPQQNAACKQATPGSNVCTS